MTVQWRKLGWAALLAGAVLTLPAAAQDDDAAPKKGKAKDEKVIKPAPRPQKKNAGAAEKAPPKVEVAVRTGDPQNLDEAWRAIDYELNFGAVDEARRLIALAMARPDFTPDNLVELRERYGSQVLLRIAATPELGDVGQRFLKTANDATHRRLQDAGRIRHFIANLEKSPSEQVFAIEELRKTGDAVAPFFAEAILANPNKPVYGRALAQMPPRLWEAVSAMLDSGNPVLQSAALDALTAYKVKASAEALYYPLASNKFPEVLQSKAQYALAQFGRLITPPDAIPELDAVADAYYLGSGGRELNDPHEVWSWKNGKLVSEPLPAAEASHLFALSAARKAYDLDANSISAQTTLASILLSKPSIRAFPPEYKALDNSVVLGRVLAQAQSDRRGMTARNAVALLALKEDQAAFQGLAAALNYPNTDVQFSAAQAVLRLQPKARFAGYERIVPILVRALRSGEARSAVIGDGDISRANATGNLLRSAGYRPRIVGSGRDVFKAAAEFGDVELIVLEPTLRNPPLADTITQLRLDARTSGIPVIVFQIDPPDFKPPVVMRPLTEVEKDMIRRRQDHQVYLEDAKTELYANAATVPERETRRFRSVDERVEYLLKRMGYITDPAEYKKLFAEIPDAIPVPAPVLLDPLVIQQIRDWYQQRVENLAQLRDRHPNVYLMPRLGKPESFAKLLTLTMPGEFGGPPALENRDRQQELAIAWIKRIAAGEFPFLDVRPAALTLSELIVNSRVGPTAADALGLIPAPSAQIRLADVALSGTQPPAVRIACVNALAASVTKYGRLFPSRTGGQLIALGADAVDGPFGAAIDSLAKALGPEAQKLLARHRVGVAPRPRPESKPAPPPITGSPTPASKETPKREPTKAKKASDDF